MVTFLRCGLLGLFLLLAKSSLFAQTDSTQHPWNWSLSSVLGGAYQDNSFVERFLQTNLNDAVSIPNTMFSSSISFGGGPKRLGVELIISGSHSRTSSALHDIQLTNQYNQYCLSYLFGNFEHLGIKGLVGISWLYMKLNVEKQTAPVSGYNTLVTHSNLWLANVGADVVWKMNPHKKLPIYTGARVQYLRSLSNSGWSYAPVESTNIGTVNTFLFGWVIGFGNRN